MRTWWNHDFIAAILFRSQPTAGDLGGDVGLLVGQFVCL